VARLKKLVAGAKAVISKTGELPTLYMHGDVDPLTSQDWLIKNLFPETGTGLLAGQWGTYKTFMVFELAASVMTGEPFIGQFKIKRRSGVLLIALEGAGEVARRLEAVVQEKCEIERAPFAWYDKAPFPLLRGDEAIKALVTMAQETALTATSFAPLAA
jgi:AAA domain